ERYDCGSKAGFLQATVSFALSRPELRDDLMQHLQKVTQLDKAAE
ncbi:MAG: UTP--glucose-1-phosphate uridylyltransferase, partial [Pseudophaeobacter sp.]